MDKGIRPYARNLFAEKNELRRRGIAPYIGPKANSIFRKEMIYTLVEQFGITVASACTHYNEALQFIKELNAELVSGLGRPPEKNNGGRKKKVDGAPMTPEETAALLLEGIEAPVDDRTDEELLEDALRPVTLNGVQYEEAPF